VGYTKDNSVGWKEVFDRLKESVEQGRYPAGAQLPTEAMLIEQFGASKMTVHRALRELAATGLVRRVERVGTFVADNSTQVVARGKIGLFLPTVDGFLEIKYLAGIREALGTDLQILLYATDNEAVIEMEMLNKAVSEVDGILMLPTGHPRVAQRLKEIHDNGCPVVCIDREPTSVRLPSVTTNNYEVTKSSLEFLIAAGHRRIAYFGLHTPEMSSNTERVRAYFDVMRASGIEEPSKLARFIEARVGEDYSVEQHLFEDALIRLMSGPDPVTAAFCANEHYLSVLIEVSQMLPPRALNGFEIASFCDWPVVSFPAVRSHLIRQDAKSIGRTAAQLLVRAMAGETISCERTELKASFEPANPMGSLPVENLGRELR